MELATTIAKRTFLDALPCAARGWYSARAPREALTPADEWSFFGGNQLGAAAREQLGAGPLLPRTPQSVALETTHRMIAHPASALLFEASFRWGSFVARADAIRRAGEGWDVIEVKSGKEPKPGKPVDAEYIDDLAYTVMVARGAGLDVARSVLLLLSREYRLGGPGQLLAELDVTDAVSSRAAEFADMAPQIEAAVRAAMRPDPALQLGCRSCDFFASTCLGAGIEETIFMLPALSQKRLDQIKPIIDLRQVPDSVDLTDNQRRVFDVMRSGKPQLLDGLDDLDRVTWPAYYLDFETVSPVLPWFAGDAPGEQHTFQYSIHVCEAVGEVSSHHEYLAGSTGDWRRALVEQMLADLGERGSVIVFTNFEEKRLEEMAALFPDLALRLAAVIARLFDLNDVIKRGYCHPQFKGSTSIKKVLPVMVPELAYAGMAIAEGQSASGVFGLMRVGEYAPDTFDDRRRDLLAYCKLDTLAMVRVHAALCQLRAAPSSS